MDLKIKDVAELLHVSETTIRRWISDGVIPVYRLRSQYRFSRIEIENWMMKCKLTPEKEGPFAEAQIYPVISETSENQPQNNPPRGGTQQFSLYRAMHKGDIYFDVPGETKEEVICAAMKLIAPALGLDAEGMTELLLDRENLMPTALNHGIAVPHTRDFLLPGPLDVIATVFPKKPIEYGALDGKPVHTCFFLFSGSDKRHLHLLAKLAHLSSNAEALTMLQKRPEKSLLLSYIKEWEAKLRQQPE